MMTTSIDEKDLLMWHIESASNCCLLSIYMYGICMGHK